jgi:phosphatidylglycerol:prolipoprotein diacylglycerol transferase
MFPEIHLGSLVFYTYGIMIGVAIVAVVGALEADFSRRHISISVIPMCLVAIFCGIVGSKLDTSLVSHFINGTPYFQGSFLQWLATGHTLLGAEAAVFAVIAVAARLYKQPLLKVLDALPAFSLGHAIGRIGCFLAGDGDYGPPTSLPWGIAFPHGIIPTALRVHPTMLYIAAWELLVFAYLWPKGNPKRYALRPQGSIFAQALILTSVGRMITEIFSRNPRVIAGLTEAQAVGILLICVGACLLVVLHHPRTRRMVATS